MARVSRVFESSVETVWAAREVDLEIFAGTMVALVGASGSGKSTLLNLIAGLDDPTSGSVRVGRTEVGTLDEDGRAELRLRQVGVVFQEHNLIGEFTALENVMLPLEAGGTTTVQARLQAAEQLKTVGLEGLGGRYPDQLSGGQRQRVGIARALAGGQRVLLADEPTGSLDSANSRQLFEIMKALTEQGTTVIVATHELMIREFADTLYEMRDGAVFSQPVLP